MVPFNSFDYIKRPYIRTLRDNEFSMVISRQVAKSFTGKDPSDTVLWKLQSMDLCLNKSIRVKSIE